MNHEPELERAKEAVLRFALAWTAWERQMANDENSVNDPVMKQAHASLIAQHCTTKKRAYVDGITTFCTPPTYGDVIESNIINAELRPPSKAHVDVKCLRMFYRFVVHKKRDGWRIDGIKWRISLTDEWVNGLIGM